MTRLVKGSRRTWATIDRIVWHGAVPSSETALRLSEITGLSVESILRVAIDARKRRKAGEHPQEAA